MLALLANLHAVGQDAGRGKENENRVTPDRAGQYPDEEEGEVASTALEGGRELLWKVTTPLRKVWEAAWSSDSRSDQAD